MNRFEYHQPASLEETHGLLARYGDDAALLAGGTALLVDMRHGELRPGHMVSLWAVPGLAGVEFGGARLPGSSPGELHVAANGGLRIGTLTTVTEMANAIAAQPVYRGLREAALLLGARQVQNLATVGGNICKASPGADLVPPLMCLDADLRLSGPEGERTAPLDGFLTGPDQTALRPAEVLTAITLPAPPERTGTAFLKIMRRKAVDCSIVAVGARVTLAGDGKTCREVRIGLAAVAPNPFRAKGAEALLSGQAATPELVREAARRARDESSPISDVRASADYRRMMVETLVERAVWKAIERAAEGGNG